MKYLDRSGVGTALFAAMISLTTCTPSITRAQEESLKPGINAAFENPNPEIWINRFEIESRVIYKNREAIIGALGLREGMDVADVGAGTGFFSLMLAEEVGPDGKIYAVDISDEFIELIAERAEEAGRENIETVLCDSVSTKLDPTSVDLVFVCDTYHHFEFPYRTLDSIFQALRPGGKLVIVDFERIVGKSTDWILGHVRCGKGQVTDEVKNAGFEFSEEIPLMEEQYIRVFVKPAASPVSGGSDE